MNKALLRARGRRTVVVNDMRALHELAVSEDRDFTEAEQVKFTALEAEVATITANITAEEAKTLRELTAGGVRDEGERRDGSLLAQRPPVFDPASDEVTRGPTRLALPSGAKVYADLFGSAQGKTGGFESREEFFRTVHSGLADPRLQAAQFEGIPSSGGFAVPEQFAADLLDESLETEIVRPRADVQPMTSDTRKVAMWDSLDHSAVLYGGFTAQWLAEGGTIAEKTAKLRMITLGAKKMGLLAQVSNEMIMDGGTFEGSFVGAMARAMSWYLDFYYLRGTGSGQPLGVLGDPALITVTKEASQAADTIQYENVAKMFARMHPALMDGAVWVANPDTIPQLLQLNIRVKNAAATDFVGGSHVAVLSESGGQMRLLTRPVLFTEKLPTLGDVGDLLFVNFSQYVIGLRKEVSIDKSIHVGFKEDTSWYRGILRTDGQGKWNKPVTPKAGSTLSWAVVLEAR